MRLQNLFLGMLLWGAPIHPVFSAASPDRTLSLSLRAGQVSLASDEVKVPVARHWQMNLVQHTHTDIGYTRSQMEILAEHLRYIDYALDYCDVTDRYPDAARFRWTCEVAWPVKEYLKNRPASQVERLKRRVKEGNKPWRHPWLR